MGSANSKVILTKNLRFFNVKGIDVLYKDERFSATKWWERDSSVYKDEITLELIMSSTQLVAKINDYKEHHDNASPEIDILIWTSSRSQPYLVTDAYIAEYHELHLTLMGKVEPATYDRLVTSHPFITNSIAELEIEANERRNPSLIRFRNILED